MSDRTAASISIGGVLRDAAAITKLVGSIWRDSAGPDYGETFCTEGQVEAFVRWHIANQQTLVLRGDEVVNGEFEEIVAACEELGLPYRAFWESNVCFDPGVRCWSPAGQIGPYLSSNDGEAAARPNQIQRVVQEGTIDDLLAELAQCSVMATPLTMEGAR